jgi:high-affinity Fe2+/Pb2+ permease
MVGLGVFFAFILGAAAARGGRITLDMTYYDELWLEYWLMFAAVGVVPWALWYLDDH